ncbi:hypothetical protein ACIRP3_42725 [Streptomyces sp. NPDC101209]|uniref:hypothetical protein n=1 Tax=Streptomyces sp. NPDC101209 TaxID=3366129 RepID=UPI0037FAD927
MSAAGSSLAKGITSAVTKRLQSKAGVRLGSRDERREVYRQFSDSVTEAYTVFMASMLEQRFFSIPLGTGRRPFIFRPGAAERAARGALPGMQHVQAETLKAYLDLRIVANPEPLAAADVVLERLTEVLDLPLAVTIEAVNNAVSRVVEAQREFTDVCRDDLWYLPQRWQVYRVGWWKARRWRRRAAIEGSAS